MARHIRSGKRHQFGFTLIELMIVMAIIITLMGMAVPFYQKSIVRAKETVLHNNLTAMRSVIDEYSYDKQKAPQTLQDLVTDGYPITGNSDTWKLIMEDAAQAVSTTEPGIFDVRSGAPGRSMEGTPYGEW